jgi:hypothetical protein
VSGFAIVRNLRNPAQTRMDAGFETQAITRNPGEMSAV